MTEFPIRMLSEMTGVAPTTLRAWERRYGLLKPNRTQKGHRLYNNDDVELVRQVVRLLGENYTISKAINAIRNGDSLAVQDDTDDALHWHGFISRFKKGIEAFDINKLDSIYNEAISLYPIDLVTVNLLAPLLRYFGESRQERKVGIAEEHFFTAYLRNKVGARFHHNSHSNHGSRILFACLPNEYHELEVLLFALSTMSRGYQTLYLGANLPLDQITLVSQRVNIKGVVLSGTEKFQDKLLIDQLQSLANDLLCPAMLIGDASDDVEVIDNAPSLICLGADFSAALGRLENIVSVYGR